MASSSTPLIIPPIGVPVLEGDHFTLAWYKSLQRVYSLINSGGHGSGVIEVDTGQGLTGGPITNTGTISFAFIPSNYTLANLSSSPGPPLPTSISSLVGAAGLVTVTGSPVAGELTTFSGPSSVTNGDLSGDVTTSGSLVTTYNNVVPANKGGAGTVSGILKANGSGTVSAAVSGTDYAPATSGSAILYGNGAGGFSSVTIGSGISFSGGTLSATGSGGTVTSVAMTVPAFLSVSGSPITTSGTLAISLANESANTVFAGPTTGAAAAPTFRALVVADLPNNGANPSATASDTAVNGSATTWMRSDAAPAVQKGSASQFGVLKVDGSTITASGGVISATGSGGGLAQLATNTVVGSSTSSVTFSSIPGTYSHLMLIGNGRTDVAGTGAISIMLRFNGDTSNNYGYGYWFGGTGSGQNALTDTAIFVGQFTQAGDLANAPGSFDAIIKDYANTTFLKALDSKFGLSSSTTLTTEYAVMSHGVWNSTAAINSITIFTASGNFVAGTKFTLYGMA